MNTLATYTDIQYITYHISSKVNKVLAKSLSKTTINVNTTQYAVDPP